MTTLNKLLGMKNLQRIILDVTLIWVSYRNSCHLNHKQTSSEGKNLTKVVLTKVRLFKNTVHIRKRASTQSNKDILLSWPAK